MSYNRRGTLEGYTGWGTLEGVYWKGYINGYTKRGILEVVHSKGVH